MDGPSEWAFSLLLISWEISSAQKAIREHVSPTGIGPGYVCDRAGNTRNMNEQARDIMIRDKFIAGQKQCALCRQLDGVAPDTPIGEIVDSCQVWESHSAPELISDGNHDPYVEHHSGDFWTRERMKLVTNVQSDISVADGRSPVLGIGEDRKAVELLVARLLQTTRNGIPNEEQVDRPTAGGPVCFLMRM